MAAAVFLELVIEIGQLLFEDEAKTRTCLLGGRGLFPGLSVVGDGDPMQAALDSTLGRDVNAATGEDDPLVTVAPRESLDVHPALTHRVEDIQSSHVRDRLDDEHRRVDVSLRARKESESLLLFARRNAP